MEMYEETLSKETIFSGHVINVRVDTIRDCYGNNSVREVVEHPGGVCVLAMDEEKRVLLVRQFRYGVGEVVLEVPAGKLEPGEEPLACGMRELTEETGYRGEEYTDLGVMFPTPAYDAERIYLFMATKLHFEGQKFDSGEYIECEWMPLQEAVDMVLQGKIQDGKTQICLLKAHCLLSQKSK